MSNRELRGSQ
jgi:hypothetical protein